MTPIDNHPHRHLVDGFASIDDIAARNSLNIEDRKKTSLERQREIEKLKAELTAEDQQVREKQPGPDDERPADEKSGPEDEQA